MSIIDNSLSLVGISHLNAPVDIREKLSIPNDNVPAIVNELKQRKIATETIVLSTCNRTELYCNTTDPLAVRTVAVNRNNNYLAAYENLFYIKTGRNMIKHTFAVASGLDSMILGEPEILGQMKKAFNLSVKLGFVGPILSKLFEKTFNVAKTIRTDTALARESISAPAICAKVAKNIFGDLSNCKLMCIGGGMITQTALEYFSEHKIASITIANRTMRNIIEFKEQYNANLIPYEEIADNLYKHDIIISATSSQLPVIGKGALEKSIELRKRRPIAVFDLAVPRDVEPEASKLEDVYIHTIDDLGKVINENLAKRKQAANEAKNIIATATEELIAKLEQVDISSASQELQSRLSAIKEKEVTKAIKDLANAKDPQEVLQTLAHRLASKYSHEPLRTLADPKSSAELIAEISSWYKERNDQ